MKLHCQSNTNIKLIKKKLKKDSIMIKLERQSTHTSYYIICQFYLFRKRSVICSLIVMQIPFFSYCFDILLYDDINVTRSNSPCDTIILHIHRLG